MPWGLTYILLPWRAVVLYLKLLEGDIAQLGERGVRNAEVGGSSPPISTNGPL